MHDNCPATNQDIVKDPINNKCTDVLLEWLFTIFLLTKENEKRSKKTQSKIENRTHQMKRLEEKKNMLLIPWMM